MSQFDLELLQKLELSGVAITAQLQPDGTLLPVGGGTEKLIAAKRDPDIHIVVMAKGQSITDSDLVSDPHFPDHLLESKSGDFWVIRVGVLAGAVELLPAVQEIGEPPFIEARKALVKQVSDGWIEGALKQSLYNELLITLNLKGHPEAVDECPWRMVLQTPEQPDSLLPKGSRLINIFNRYKALLILGEPGSGKTTMLLDLARDLIDRAKQNHTLPIPVVFHLSSWAQERQPIAEWLIDELNKLYRIEEKIARLLLNQGNLLLLLDGLDEVKSECRDDCVTAINQFRAECFTPLVICCRIADYETLIPRLQLPAAVLLQPLTTQQINDYLQLADARLSVIGNRLENDTPLQELFELPLTLSIMILAYQGKSIEELQFSSSNEGLYGQLVDTYIHKMLEDRDNKQQYTPAQTYHWLAWLAQRMSQHSQTVFLLEYMQPSWLLTRTQWWLYTVGTRLIIGIIVGFISGLPMSFDEAQALKPTLIMGFIWGPLAGLSGGIIDAVRPGQGGILSQGHILMAVLRLVTYMLMVGLVGGLICTLTLAGLLIISGDIEQSVEYSIEWFRSNVDASMGTESNWSSLLYIFVMLVPISGLLLAPIGLIMGLIMELSAGRYPHNEIRLLNVLRMSFRGVANGCLVGATIGLVALYVASSLRGEAYGNFSIAHLGGLITVAFRYWMWRKQKPSDTPQVTAMYFSPDGAKLATISEDNTVRLCDSSSGNEVVELRHDNHVIDILFLTDTMLISTVADKDDTFCLWDIVCGKAIASFQGVLKIAITKDSSRFATVSKENVHLWDGINIRELAILHHEVPVSEIVFDDNNLQLGTVAGHEVHLWDTISGRKLSTLYHEAPVLKTTFSNNGSRLTTVSGVNNKICIWDLNNETVTIVLDQDRVFSVDFSGYGSRFATTEEERIVYLWNGIDGGKLAALRHTAKVWGVDFNVDDSRLTTATEDEIVHLWNGVNGAKVATLRHAARVWNVEFSSDGSRIATVCEDDTVHLWNGISGDMLVDLHHPNSIQDIVFSANGSRLATLSGSDTIQLVDCASGKELAMWRHGAPVWSTIFSDDGSRLATVGDDNTVRLWDGKNGDPLATIHSCNKQSTGKTLPASWTGKLMWMLFITVYFSLPLQEDPLLIVGLGFQMLIWGLMGGAIGGLSRKNMESTNYPNQGIHLSILTSFISGLGVGLVGGLIPGLVDGWDSGLLWGIGFGLLGALCRGGFSVIQHYILRVILYKSGYIPLNYARFLDYATERLFLRKVGSSYIFIHRLLMEHFAKMETGRS